MIIVLQCSIALHCVAVGIYYLHPAGADISALISAQRLDLFKIVMDKNWFHCPESGAQKNVTCTLWEF